MTPPSDQSVGPGAVLVSYFQREISSLVLFKPFPSGEGAPKGWTSPKPSPWGPTPLVKGRCREATEGIGKGGWPLGQTDEGTMTGHVRLSRGVAAPAARYFPSDGKVPKGSPGDGSEWTLRVHIRLTPGPPLRGTRTCRREQNFRRAKSEWRPRFIPPHWGLAFQKLKLVRFHSRAWLGRAGDNCSPSRAGLCPAPT